MTTSTYRIEGAATLLSSLSHGGEHAGTVGFLRREKIMQPDGQIVEVPIVSGNALRGLLRDHAADVMWRALGSPELPVAHSLACRGGVRVATEKSSDSSTNLLTPSDPSAIMMTGRRERPPDRRSQP